MELLMVLAIGFAAGAYLESRFGAKVASAIEARVSALEAAAKKAL